MSNIKKNFYGVSLAALAFSFSNLALAQSCAVPPTCESLGYTKSASDCGSLATLKCPFDSSKMFCTAYTDENGKKVAEIGDFVYTDTVSAEPILGRVPVGIVYDLSGKMMSIAEYGNTDKCRSHAADGINGWTLASLEDMSMIKNQVTKINASLDKLSGAPKITIKTTEAYSNHCCYLVGSNTSGACMLSGEPIASGKTTGCMYCSDVSGQYKSKSRCVRAVGPGNSPSVTYTVGGEYKDTSGTTIGTVISINNAGGHGTIISRIARTSSKAEAVTYCEGLKTGGLTWSLPSFEHMSKACSAPAAGYSYPNAYWINDGGFYVQDYSFKPCGSSDNNVAGDTGSKQHFCVATF